ncbi:MAG: glycoside hydrolase family 25 protein [Chitinophagales bacterium]
MNLQQPISIGDYPIKGVDFSHHTGTPVNFETIKNEDGFQFVSLKASSVRGRIDPNFKQYWGDAKAAGITRGAYHYMYHDHTAEYDANLFLEAIGEKLEEGDLPPVLDMEIQNPPFEKMHKWLSIVEKALGVKPMLYTGMRYYNDNNFAEHFPDYTLWIARYNRHNHPPTQDWTFWQWQQNVNIKGVPGLPNKGVDLNVFRGTKEEFNQLLYKKTN